MKFEKRSGDEAETPSSAPEETPSTGKKPVVIYIMILFIVAFLLMALSFLMHQRSNSEVLGELQDSVTAMQEVQATQDALLDLQNQLDEAQTTIDALESSAEETDAALAEAQRENQALLALYTIQQQYSAGDLAGSLPAVCAAEGSSRGPLSSQRLAIVSRETCNINKLRRESSCWISNLSGRIRMPSVKISKRSFRMPSFPW